MLLVKQLTSHTNFHSNKPQQTKTNRNNIHTVKLID